MKNWYIELYVKGKYTDTYHPLGTEYTMLYNDLKTLRGVINRMKKWIPFTSMIQQVVGFKIYTYTDLYDDDTFRLVTSSFIDNNEYSPYLYREILSEQLYNMKVK